MPGPVVVSKEAKEARRRALTAELARAVQVLKGLGARLIVVFGSLVEGHIGRTSDVDLIVVLESDLTFPRRLAMVYEAVDPRVAMDILPYTPEEFVEMKSWSAFVQRALRTGKIVYDAGPES
jgi:predicted nucleotidyltransferase